MSDCCAPGSGFPSASTMETLATNLPVVWEEICKIQQAILAASSQCQVGGGQMSTTVSGNTPMTFVSGVNSIDVLTGGVGYYQDMPSVKFTPPVGSSGSGATGTVVTNGGAILSISITNGGSGYSPIPATLTVTTSTGSGANIIPLVDGSTGIVNTSIIAGGTNYSVNDIIVPHRAVVTNPAYVDAVLKITSVGNIGQILSIAVITPGSGYQDSETQVSIVSTLNSSLPYPIGVGFYGTVLVNSSGVITGVQVVNLGAGYTNYLPYLVITDPGTGASTKVVLTGTAVSAINVLLSGSNYTSSATGNIYNPPTATGPNPPSVPATVRINTNVNTFGTNPLLYWQTWKGAITNKPIQIQLNAVLSYFQNLGYAIVIQDNPQSQNTIQWYISW